MPLRTTCFLFLQDDAILVPKKVVAGATVEKILQMLQKLAKAARPVAIAIRNRFNPDRRLMDTETNIDSVN